MSFSNIFKNISGEFEIGRTLLASSGVSAIVSPWVFQFWDMWRGAHFDVTAWCAAYPTGLGVLAGVGVFTLGKKDKDVAQAKFTQATTDATVAAGATP